MARLTLLRASLSQTCLRETQSQRSYPSPIARKSLLQSNVFHKLNKTQRRTTCGTVGRDFAKMGPSKKKKKIKNMTKKKKKVSTVCGGRACCVTRSLVSVNFARGERPGQSAGLQGAVRAPEGLTHKSGCSSLEHTLLCFADLRVCLGASCVHVPPLPASHDPVARRHTYTRINLTSVRHGVLGQPVPCGWRATWDS